MRGRARRGLAFVLEQPHTVVALEELAEIEAVPVDREPALVGQDVAELDGVPREGGGSGEENDGPGQISERHGGWRSLGEGMRENTQLLILTRT